MHYLVDQIYQFEIPANAMHTCSSRAHILRTVLSSCNFATDFFSTPSTTMSLPLIPTCAEKKIYQVSDDSIVHLRDVSGNYIYFVILLYI